MGQSQQLFIDGQWVESADGETFETVNPAAPSETVGTYQQGTREDATQAIEAAAQAQPGWGNTAAPQRGKILRKAAANLDERKTELTELLTDEEGKTLAEAGGEVQRAIDIFYYYAEQTRDFAGSMHAASSNETTLYTRREPVGVASLITPWNYPIAIPAWKLAPALATGNAVVLKPASLAPGVAIGVVQALADAGLPDGVVNLVTGPGSQVGDELVTNELVDAVSFTGSCSVGEAVYEDAASREKRVQTEMGGKNPTIVGASADLDRAVDLVSAGAFGVTGQACTACSRAIVHTDVYQDFVDAIVEQAESIEIGPGREADMGPQVSHGELDGTLEYIEIAESEGGSVQTGGKQLDREGHFIAPTVITDVDPEDTIAQEEIFGPVLAVFEVESFDDAMDLANNVEFGLSSSIVTNDHTEAERFIREIQAGVAKVNDKTTGLELHVPFGGFKRSSSETWREQGDAGLHFFSIEKTVYENI